jgi:hypothetical protein
MLDHGVLQNGNVENAGILALGGFLSNFGICDESFSPLALRLRIEARKQI